MLKNNPAKKYRATSNHRPSSSRKLNGRSTRPCIIHRKHEYRIRHSCAWFLSMEAYHWLILSFWCLKKPLRWAEGKPKSSSQFFPRFLPGSNFWLRPKYLLVYPFISLLIDGVHWISWKLFAQHSSLFSISDPRIDVFLLVRHTTEITWKTPLISH